MLSFLACSRAKENSGIVNSEHASSEVVEVIRNGLSFNYQSCGEGDTTLLLVHGWCIDQSYWSSQIEAFCGEYKVVSMELAGFSTIQEARKSWTIEEYGQDVIALIDYLALEHVVLVGHSMGGDIILEAALVRPEEIIGFVGVGNFKDVGEAYSEEDQEEIARFLEMLEKDFVNVAPA
ncbi:alpha/beta hydrolase [Porifericola rhodea]|uniref:alpha/beta fold hydrolase n=1 Tax=Porifericola rhodea TaxID=930972 RepID=UPI002665A1FD|nr:alpha/beta hydrolase [Porifericola rhodea]WKN33746.1 alpha/beta hydrolase [Porifericola rhodea]